MHLSYFFAAAGLNVPARNIGLTIDDLEATAFELSQVVAGFCFYCHNLMLRGCSFGRIGVG
jgi:hypothetical protein